jgi:hypothetical protein
MVLIPLVAAPSLMLLAVAAERRFGAGVAGTVGAAPLGIALVVLSVGDQAPVLAGSAAAHVAAQVAFAVGFSLFEGALGFATGTAAFAATSALIAFVPAPLATLAAGPALILGSPGLPLQASAPPPPPAPRRPPPARPAAGAVAVFLLVAASLTVAHVAGPVVAGAVAAFPALSGTLALIVGRGTLPGLVRGLRGYLMFCLSVAALGAPLGVPVGLALAVASARGPSSAGSAAARSTSCGSPLAST